MSTRRWVGKRSQDAMQEISADDHGLRIAVVGTGMAALMCVRSLAQKAATSHTLRSAKITFCTSRGKLATQMGPKNQTIPQPGKPFFDYGCQYFTADDPWFAKEVEYWASLGYLQALPDGDVGMISAQNGFRPVSGTKCWVGSGGMGPALTRLIEQTVKEFAGVVEHVPGFPNADMAVKKLSKLADGWQLSTQSGVKLGPFDFVVGGFAQHVLTDPFLLSGGAPCEQMLKCLRRVESNQLIPIQVSFEGEPLPARFTAAHVYEEPSLGFISNNSRKPQQNGTLGTSGSSHWTLISTSEFAEREFNCNAKGYRRAAEEQMLGALARVLDIEDISQHRPVVNRVNHWEDGLAVNSPPQSRGCLFDPKEKLGWVGDFCVQPGIQGAALSGKAMAEILDQFLNSSASESFDGRGLLPADEDWLPFLSGMTLNGTLMDIGTFSPTLGLRPLYTHTDLVPSAVNGYDPMAHTGAAGAAKGGSKSKGNGKGKGKEQNKGKGKGKEQNRSKGKGKWAWS